MKTSITKKLDELGIKYTVKPHRQPVYTSQDAARERNVRLSQIVKTMLLMDRDGKMVVAVLPGDRRLDIKKIKKLLGVKDLRFLDKETVEKRLGLVAGAIAPIAELFDGLEMFVDPTVFDEDFVDISSGVASAGLELSRKDLRSLLEECNVVKITI
ncbi:MAG: YbaK/EbsC family protein [Deltaproteobacteria bacterium]|nr:MAG: YbaK/EbsC family protein [Deltaproteobacteria bacterium]